MSLKRRIKNISASAMYHRSTMYSIKQNKSLQTILKQYKTNHKTAITLTVAILFGIFTLSITNLKNIHQALAAPTSDTCFAYTSDSPSVGQATITDYYDHENNDSGQPACTRDPEIPSTLGGDSVTTIGNSAFYNNQLTSVTIPNSVITIASSAFGGNQLTSVTIPNSVTTIGDEAFTENKLTSVSLGNSVTTIGDEAFSSNKLISVAIPNSVTSIGNTAFADNQLTSVTIEGNITTAGGNEFSGSPIQTFTYGSDTYTTLYPITDDCFAFDGVNTITDFKKADITTIRDHSNACLNPSVSIPSTIGGTAVLVIGSSAFNENQLTSVTIPNSVTTIGSGAFQGNQLTSVTIPNSVTTIGGYAFFSNQIADATISDSVTTLNPDAFIAQNKSGGTSYMDFLTSGFDPQIGQNFQDSVILTNIYTSPNQVTALSLVDLTITEADGPGIDVNADGDQTDILSGQLINPSRVTANYKDTNGNTIAPSTIATGTGLTTYLAKDNPTNDLGLYYRAGGSYTVPTAPTIAGYEIVTTPSNIASLSAGNNQINYVYKATSNNNGTSNTANLTTPTSPISAFSLRPVSISTPTGTNITSSSTVAESSLSTQDSNNEYPLGLVNFSFTTNQSSNQVVLTFITDLTPNQVTPKKYNPSTNTYTNLPTSSNPTITETTINNQHALVLTYTLIDNGELDLDPTIGTIKDPVGLAVSNTTYDQLANTGSNATVLVIGAGSLISMTLVIGIVKRRHISYRLFG